MKTLIAIIASCAVLSGAAFAGCGKKVTSEGKLKEYDAAKKSVVLTKTNDKKGLTITAKTKLVGKDGKEAKLEDLVKEKEADLVAISEHGKVDWFGYKSAVPKKKKGEKKEKAG